MTHQEYKEGLHDNSMPRVVPISSSRLIFHLLSSTSSRGLYVPRSSVFPLHSCLSLPMLASRLAENGLGALLNGMDFHRSRWTLEALISRELGICPRQSWLPRCDGNRMTAHGLNDYGTEAIYTEGTLRRAKRVLQRSH